MSKPTLTNKAIIYCRVSSQRQVDEGSGLGSQEKLCRNWADSRGYRVVKVFGDKGVSGALFDRPAMHELMEYLDKNSHEQFVVIFDDLKRFARDYQVHLQLKMELVKARGAILECLNFNFENTPESEFIEGVLALQGELERKQNRRQVINKMRARLERGYWPFCPPPGLKNTKSKEHGKILTSDEPLAGIIKEAIEGYEKHLFNTQHEVLNFIKEKYNEFQIKRPISIHGVQRILTNPLYAGLIEHKLWNIPLADGKHKGFVSKETFNNVQDKYYGRSKPKLVKSYSLDFPLRGFVTCSICGSKLRASWNSGRTKKYPNYWCQNRECQYLYKITKAWDLHPQFEEVLSQAKVEEDKADLSKAIYLDIWDEETSFEKQKADEVSEQIDLLNREIQNYAKRVANAKSQILVDTYETQIESLGKQKEKLEEIDLKPKYTKKMFGSAISDVYDMLKDPLDLWKRDNLEDKRTVLWMYFENGLNYDYEQGFGTPNFSPAINLLRDPASAEFRDVEMPGNDPGSEFAK